MNKIFTFGLIALIIHCFYKYQGIKKRYQYENIDIESKEDLMNLIKISKNEYWSFNKII